MFRHYALYCLKTSRSLHIGLILLIVASLLYWGCLREQNRYSWNPITFALPLNQAITLDASFTAKTPYPIRYFIDIDIDRTLPSEKLDEALAQICSGLKCQVSSDVGAVQEGDYRGNSYGTTVSQTIDTFEAVPGRRYTIHVRGSAIPQERRMLHPRLKATVSPMDWEPHMISTALLFMLACLLSLLGFICLCGSCFGLIVSYHERGVPKPAS